MSLTPTQRKVLEKAAKGSGSVFSGWNPGSFTIGANTLAVLERLGLVTLGKTSMGETYATLTRAGWREAGVVLP